MRGLIDPRLKTHLGTHWPSVCTIRRIVYTPSKSNQQIKSGSTVVFNKVQCRISAMSHTRPTDNEQRTETIQALTTQRIVKLNGYFPSVEAHEMEAVVDGVTYPIRGVEHDSEHFSTRLFVEVIIP